MSDGADDIVFGDVSYREPERLRRPDRDRRRACMAYEVPSPGDLPIFLDLRPADHIERHALRDTTVELGGILLGKECVDDETGEPFVLITEALEAKHYENTQASFTYTHDSWEEITRERDLKHPDLDIVGWYHTHPDFGVFLSSHDLFIHHNFFSQVLQVAYVVDPIRQTRGFFQWKHGEMHQVRGFFIASDRADRPALARLVNNLENLPVTESGGTGLSLSPRLEAELIAMLSRSHNAPSPASDRMLAASVFSLFGLLMGIAIVSAVLWLGLLNRQVDQTTEAVKDLAKTQKETAEQFEKTIETARVSAREEALDAMLAQTSSGPPGTASRKFSETLQEVQTLRDRLSALETQRDALASFSTDLKGKVASLSNQVDRYEKEGLDELNEAKADLKKADAENEALQDEVDRQKGLLEESGVADLERRYNLMLWMALGGWSAFVIALGTAAYLYTRMPVADHPLDDPGIPLNGGTVPPPGSHPNQTHVIE